MATRNQAEELRAAIEASKLRTAHILRVAEELREKRLRREALETPIPLSPAEEHDLKLLGQLVRSGVMRPRVTRS